MTATVAYEQGQEFLMELFHDEVDPESFWLSWVISFVIRTLASFQVS
jgi:hypothetical protein